jgi:hypothetical protein
MANVMNLASGVIAVIIGLIEKIINYNSVATQCRLIVKHCSSVEDDIIDLINTPFKYRNPASTILNQIDHNYDTIRNSCVDIIIPLTIVSKYKKMVNLEISKLTVNSETKKIYTSAYLAAIGDSPII